MSVIDCSCIEHRSMFHDVGFDQSTLDTCCYDIYTMLCYPHSAAVCVQDGFYTMIGCLVVHYFQLQREFLLINNKISIRLQNVTESENAKLLPTNEKRLAARFPLTFLNGYQGVPCNI